MQELQYAVFTCHNTKGMAYVNYRQGILEGYSGRWIRAVK